MTSIDLTSDGGLEMNDSAVMIDQISSNIGERSRPCLLDIRSTLCCERGGKVELPRVQVASSKCDKDESVVILEDSFSCHIPVVNLDPCEVIIIDDDDDDINIISSSEGHDEVKTIPPYNSVLKAFHKHKSETKSNNGSEDFIPLPVIEDDKKALVETEDFIPLPVIEDDIKAFRRKVINGKVVKKKRCQKRKSAIKKAIEKKNTVYEQCSSQLSLTKRGNNNKKKQHKGCKKAVSKPLTNVFNPHPSSFIKKGLRPIVIDGCNVGRSHSGTRFISWDGIKICIDYFIARGHTEIKVFIPQLVKPPRHVESFSLVEELSKDKFIVFTPSRKVENRWIIPYDDRYIVQYAVATGGVIVSRDNFADIINDDPSFSDVIQNRILNFTWVGDMIMFPHDPMGKNGPTLDEFLRFPE